MCSAISSSISSSRSLMWSSRRLQYLGDGQAQALPAVRLLVELLAPGPGEGVVAGPPVVLRLSPLRLDPASLRHPIERRVERALLHPQDFLGQLVNALGDGE